LLPARITQGKGHIDLLLAAECTDWEIYFAGDGDLDDEVKKHANGARKIHFLGWVTDMVSLYNQVSIVVLPSYSEGMPNGLTEAMSYGKPVVAYANDGARELIQNNENGILVEIGDIKGLRMAINRLIDDEDFARKIGLNGKKYIEQNFTIDEMGNQTVSFLATLQNQS
jgi:glycosyltransferase involved in cell wall biosynthesis